MTFTAVIEPTGTGYSGYLIELAGRIIAVGDTPDEVSAHLCTAAADMVQDSRAQGERLPLSATIVRRLEVA
jgi:predicted RNase H-like HicB family nuclease